MEVVESLIKIAAVLIAAMLLEGSFICFAYAVTFWRIPQYDWAESKKNFQLLEYYLMLYGKPVFGYLNLAALLGLFLFVANNYHDYIST